MAIVYKVNTNGRLTIIGDNEPDLFEGSSKFDRLLGGGGNDTLKGAGDTDNLSGGDGNDVLDGGTDFDAMSGGRGDDTYYVDDVNDIVNESENLGTDKVYSTVDYVSKSYTEEIELIGTADIGIQAQQWDETLKGNTGKNLIDGNFGKDVIDGGAGDDTLAGGGDQDTITGGEGKDTFKYSYNDRWRARTIEKFPPLDIITDFQPNEVIEFDAREIGFVTPNFTFSQANTEEEAALSKSLFVYVQPLGKLYINLNLDRPGFFNPIFNTGGAIYELLNKPVFTRNNLRVV